MTKQDILDRISAARPTRDVTCPDGSTWTVRTITVGERANLANLKGLDFALSLLAVGLGDGAGDRLFGDAEKAALKGLDSVTADVLADAVLRFNKLRDEDITDVEKS